MAEEGSTELKRPEAAEIRGWTALVLKVSAAHERCTGPYRWHRRKVWHWIRERVREEGGEVEPRKRGIAIVMFAQWEGHEARALEAARLIAVTPFGGEVRLGLISGVDAKEIRVSLRPRSWKSALAQDAHHKGDRASGPVATVFNGQLSAAVPDISAAASTPVGVLGAVVRESRLSDRAGEPVWDSGRSEAVSARWRIVTKGSTGKPVRALVGQRAESSDSWKMNWAARALSSMRWTPKDRREEMLSGVSRDQGLIRALAAVGEQLDGWNASGVGVAAVERDAPAGSPLAVKILVDRHPNVQEAGRPLTPEALELPGFGELLVMLEQADEITPGAAGAGGGTVAGVQLGRSISHKNGPPGSIGCLVRLSNRVDPFVLSCSHVLALSGAARRGDKVHSPSPQDGPARYRMRLQHFRRFQTRGANAASKNVDAALAGPVASAWVKQFAEAGIPVKGLRTRPPEIGLKVGLEGRTTKLPAPAAILGLLNREIPYLVEGATLQIPFTVYQCARYASGGDSGAIVIDADGRAIGLHIAGSDIYSYFIPLRRVLSALNVRLWDT